MIFSLTPLISLYMLLIVVLLRTDINKNPAKIPAHHPSKGIRFEQA